MRLRLFNKVTPLPSSLQQLFLMLMAASAVTTAARTSLSRKVEYLEIGCEPMSECYLACPFARHPIVRWEYCEYIDEHFDCSRPSELAVIMNVDNNGHCYVVISETLAMRRRRLRLIGYSTVESNERTSYYLIDLHILGEP